MAGGVGGRRRRWVGAEECEGGVAKVSGWCRKCTNPRPTHPAEHASCSVATCSCASVGTPPPPCRLHVRPTRGGGQGGGPGVHARRAPPAASLLPVRIQVRCRAGRCSAGRGGAVGGAAERRRFVIPAAVGHGCFGGAGCRGATPSDACLSCGTGAVVPPCTRLALCMLSPCWTDLPTLPPHRAHLQRPRRGDGAGAGHRPRLLQEPARLSLIRLWRGHR